MPRRCVWQQTTTTIRNRWLCRECTCPRRISSVENREPNAILGGNANHCSKSNVTLGSVNRHYDLFRLSKRIRSFVLGTGSQVSTKHPHTVDLGRLATSFEQSCGPADTRNFGNRYRRENPCDMHPQKATGLRAVSGRPGNASTMIGIQIILNPIHRLHRHLRR